MTNWLIASFEKKLKNEKDLSASLGKLAGYVGLFCNVGLAVLKLALGIITGSIAIIGDAVNNFSDTAASVITLAGFSMSKKPADKEHPFGHARFEYIAGFVVAILVLFIGVELAQSSVTKIMNPQDVSFSVFSIVLLAVAIVVKIWLAFFYRDIGKRIGSMSLQAAFVDSRNDVITTAAVLVSAAMSIVFGWQIDGYIGLLVAVFIVVSGIGLMKEVISPLLGQAPDSELVKELGDEIASYPGVLDTHDLLVHDYGLGRKFASAHVEMDSAEDVMKSHEVIDGIEKDIRQKYGIHLIIHHDPILTGADATDSEKGKVLEKIKSIDSQLKLHDFSMEDDGHTLVYRFDVILPEGFVMDENELRDKVNNVLRKNGKAVIVYMTIDHGYAAIPK